MYTVYREIKRWSTRWVFACVLALCILPTVVHATHIIGGEINYTCLGGEQYEVELTVYRDCFFGAANAFFDNPASIGIFDSNGVLLDELKLPFLNNDTLAPFVSDSCLFVPNTVCVHTASYRGEVNLPFTPGGYTMVYQRCCRNGTINNIIDPLNTGATFTAFVSGNSLQECNSGPKFREFPPLYICVNEPINFDHSAIDAEGDSLVYSLCTPFAGGDIVNNQPQPPPPPPYDTVTYANPFGLNNILGGTDVLSIDANTGFLTGTPPTLGQYVVGVCIEEYKDGQLISSSRRDFQYNVGECGIVSASIANDTIQCENQDLNFINTSSNSDNFEWYFGDINNPGLNSIDENPNYVFPDTGVFTITLIAEANSECADTLVQDILFKNSTLDVDFDLLVLECVDSVLLTVNNMTVDTFLGIESLLWELSDGQSSDEFNPTFILAKSQPYTLSLTAVAFDGCSETEEFDFFANVISSGVIDTFSICPGASVALNENPFLGPNVSYTWTPSAGLDDANSPNPIANPSVTTLYTVSIDDPQLDCSGSFSIMVEVQENNASIQLEDNELICTDTYLVSASTSEIVSFEWSQQPDFENIISTDSSFMFSESGNQTFYLRTTDELACTFMDEVSIAAGSLNVDTSVDDQSCLGQPILAMATNLDPVDNVTINWEPSSLVLDGQGTLQANLLPSSIGENTYFAFISNQFGCERVDTFNVNVISDQAITEVDIDIDRSNCDPSMVIFNTDHINITNYQYEFVDGTVIIPGEESIEYTFPGPGSYQVILRPQDFVNCDILEPVQFAVEVPTEIFTTDFSSQVTNCGDIIEVNLTDLSEPFVGTITSVDWVFDDGQSASGQNIALTFDQGGLYTFTVDLISNLGCTTTYDGMLDLTGANILDVSFLDQDVLACNGDPVALNPNGNETYEYSWTPAVGLNDANAVNPTTNPSTTSTFTVTVTDPVSGCVVERDVTVTVPSQQLEANFSVAFNGCIGTAELQFTDQSAYSESDIISWAWTFSDRADILTDQNPIITIDEDENLEVTLQVTTEDGCEAQFTDFVVVDILDVNLPVDDTFVCFEVPTELNPNGSDQYTYSWSPANELNTATGANPIATLTATTNFSVTISDEISGCETVEEFTLVVPSESPRADFELDILSCDASGPIEFQLISLSDYSDADIVEYIWTIDLDSETLVSNEENPILTIDAAEVVSISLVINTEDGCTDSTMEEVSINAIDFIIDEIEITICDSEPTMLNANADMSLTYLWSPSAGLSDPNIPNPIANPDVTTIYSVTISNPENGDCAVIQEVEVIVPVFEVDVDFDASFLNCGATVDVQFFDLTTFSGTDIIAWNWDFGNEMTSDEQNPVITLDETSMLNTTLIVTTSDGCEVTSLSPQSMVVDVILIDETSFNETLNVCMGENIFINEGGDNQYTYEWSPADNLDDPTSPNPQFINADISTEFTVTISNISLDTCSIQRTVLVNVFDTPNPIIEGENQENICTAEGELSIDLGPGETIEWYDDAAMSNIISTEPTLITTPGTGTTYFAMVSNQFGCGSEVVSFTSISRELLLEPEIASQILCLDDQTELSAIVNSPESPNNWTWSPLDQIDEFIDESVVLVSPDLNTTYTLTASNDFGCETQITFDVEVIDLQNTVDATITTSDLITGQPVTLFVTQNEDYTYSWSPAGLLDDPTSASPTFTLTEEVTFEVEVTDSNGCIAVRTVVVTPADTPCAEPFVFVPNAFSPNGDGLNEQLHVDGNQIVEMHLMVYNRWGERVFEAIDQSQSWDGTYNGKALDPDVFGYTFTCTCTNGDTFSSQGNISLLR